MSAWHDRVGDLTLIEALTGRAFGGQNWHHSGEFDQNFSKKSNGGGGMGSFGIDRYIRRAKLFRAVIKGCNPTKYAR